ncbi:MAG: hypothetical protein Q7K54_05435 [Candidatus Parcubacteria bacterium]|nr:hypothetical protein [Candidatus Parcubacteria bacterium]
MATENDKTEKPSDRELDLLKLEYEKAISHGEFIVGIRFNYFLSFTTFFFILVGAFHYVLITEEKVFGGLKPWLMFAIALFGFYTVVVAFIIELRSVQLYRASDQRAADLEMLMGIKNGIRQILLMPKRKIPLIGIPVGHAAGIAMFYGAVSLFWILLTFFSYYQILA